MTRNEPCILLEWNVARINIHMDWELLSSNEPHVFINIEHHGNFHIMRTFLVCAPSESYQLPASPLVTLVEGENRQPC